MKPLVKKDLDTFLERFDNFIDGELRNIEVSSATTIKITLAGQDKSRGFDWITVDLEFSGVSDARLIDNSKLQHVDMSDAVSILNESNSFAFGIGNYLNLSSIKNSTLYVISENIKYQEGTF